MPLFDNRRVATIEFPLADFHKWIHAFAFIPGHKQHVFAQFLVNAGLNYLLVTSQHLGHASLASESRGNFRGPW